MVFVGGSNPSIDDLSRGLTLALSGSPANVTLGDFAQDPTGVIDLRGGLGGSLDFTGVAVSQLHASNFQIG
jgi:hypothetical protein